jgi:hypothetical protein
MFGVVFLAFFSLALAATPAQADLTVDLRAVSTNGPATIDNIHSVTVTGLGATITCEAWGIVTGADGTDQNDGVSHLWGGFRQTLPVAGADRQIVGTFLDPVDLMDPAFRGAGVQYGHPTMTTTNPPYVSRIGGTTGNWWCPLSANPTKTYQPGMERHLGTFTFVVDNTYNPAALGPATNLTYFRGTSTSNAWYEDDVLRTMTTGNGTYSLIPVVLNMPEPSTLALLGIGAMGMLGYVWRRKRAA